MNSNHDPEALTTLRRSIMENASRGEFTATAAAATAKLSLRTAQRLTREHGSSLQQLIDEVRLANAKNFLSDPAINISKVGHLLGYADVRAFRRAFKRWTNFSPKEYRRVLFNEKYGKK